MTAQHTLRRDQFTSAGLRGDYTLRARETSSCGWAPLGKAGKYSLT